MNTVMALQVEELESLDAASEDDALYAGVFVGVFAGVIIGLAIT